MPMTELRRGPLMAQSRHAQSADECPLSGVGHDAGIAGCLFMTQSGHRVVAS